jgi:hypothetical protein
MQRLRLFPCLCGMNVVLPNDLRNYLWNRIAPSRSCRLSPMGLTRLPTKICRLQLFTNRPTRSALCTYAGWGYTYTCADWAEDAFHTATGETVDSSDWVIFGTPRAIAGSIITLETTHPTTSDMPMEGGEDASSTSTGSSWGGSSF